MQENLQKRAQLEKSRRWILAGTAAGDHRGAAHHHRHIGFAAGSGGPAQRPGFALDHPGIAVGIVFALRSYNGIYSTGADVDGSILPTVRQHLNTATALNNILTNGFGSAYSVFTQDLYNRLEHFYSEYELARSANRSTDTAMELLDSCMRDIENIVLTRFEADGRVIL